MSETPIGAGRLPPHNPEAERSVLGSMLRENSVIDDVVQIIKTESYFYQDAHQRIFKAANELHDKGHPVDLVTLANKLQEEKQIEDVGGYAYLGDLWDAAPTAANAEYYARIVREKALVRGLIQECTGILHDAYDQSSPADELLGVAEQKVLAIAEQGTTGSIYTLADALHEAYDRIDARHQGENLGTSGIPTGFADLDEKTAGLQPSELIIVAARPSVGKTAFALNMARHMAVKERVPIFFVSLEMSRIELVERLLCSEAEVDSHKLRTGRLSAVDMDKIIKVGGIMSNCNLFFDDTPGQSMLRISANARRLKQKEQIKVVMIDYLQLIEPDNRREPRQEQVANISRRLKHLARELKIPVVALAQVNRSSEDRQDHKPRLSDLRESGSIEQDADTVMLLHRPEDNEGAIEVNVAKQRNGPTGEITLTFIKKYMRFRSFEAGEAFS
jgi:replicative DNA helicase